MYKESLLPARILIVKTSSLGDIIQSFVVLDDLHHRFPEAKIDWAVESSLYSIVSTHPLIRKAISLPIKTKHPNRSIWDALKELRKERYDLVFDLQGNCKSGLITMLSRAKVKVGYALNSVREWPNILATNIRFNVPKISNIRLFYLGLIERYFNVPSSTEMKGARFQITSEERELLSTLLSSIVTRVKIMVCPGSKWANKQLKRETLIHFLQRVEGATGGTFLLIWGNESEKALCKQIQTEVRSLLVDRLSIPAWQNLMSEMDLVIGVDSSALHLCGTTSTPSFSIFGPTSLEVFKPMGSHHFALQGACPYGRVFEKQCPLLRSCPTGACIKDLTVQELFEAFQSQCAFLQH